MAYVKECVDELEMLNLCFEEVRMKVNDKNSKLSSQIQNITGGYHLYVDLVIMLQPNDSPKKYT